MVSCDPPPKTTLGDCDVTITPSTSPHNPPPPPPPPPPPEKSGTSWRAAVLGRTDVNEAMPWPRGGHTDLQEVGVNDRVIVVEEGDG